MREEKFKVIQYIRDFIQYIEKSLMNFPKTEIEYKHRIRELSFEMLELSYVANCVTDVSIKKEKLEYLISKIKMMDFLINYMHDKEVITKKKYVSCFNKLDMILKYATGWYLSLEKNNK